MNALWTAADAIAATKGQALGARDWQATGVSIDTRTLAKGDLFVALKGETQDGHAHIADAFAKGAAAALVSHAMEHGPGILVPDTLAALGALGVAARARCAARALAVTGSVGKTSTKEALAAALGHQAKTHAAAASFNNRIGVPITLARLPADSRYGVFEVGMNHAGEIAPLVRMVRPHVSMITTVEAVHVENFADGIEGVAAAKAEIFEAGGEAAILPRDNPFFDFLKARAKACGIANVLSFGTHEKADARLADWQGTATGSMASVELMGKRLDFAIGAPGRHWAMNLAGALLAIKALGGDAAAAAASFAAIAAPKGRGAQHRIVRADGTQFLLIDDSYNASPPSMRAAFAVLAATQATRRVAVLGDMLELGPDSPALHADLAPSLVAAGIAKVFCCGTNMARLCERLPASTNAVHAKDSAALEPLVLAGIEAGDAIVVKGSLGSRMGRIVAALLAQHQPTQASGR
jgi:UDP-N-acetylmuramoyl-tripeptide--D-alanyl-D-alanine ligase